MVKYNSKEMSPDEKTALEYISSKGYQVIAKEELQPTSYVLDKDKLNGMPYNMWVYSLDGRTLEEISRMTYAAWLDDWNKKWE